MTASPSSPASPAAAVRATHDDTPRRAAVIGAGPSGLMAAERLSLRGIAVTVFDAMPSAARKFLMAGKGGMNITHSEPPGVFLPRYAARCTTLTPHIERFTPDDLRAWVHTLGIDTFIGTSGRVFPADMKAAPLLRAWLQRLRAAGVTLRMRHKWLAESLPEATAGVQSLAPPRYHLRFSTPAGIVDDTFDSVVFAMGGASWPQLGSDAAWLAAFRDGGIPVADFSPSNSGFETAWTPFFKTRFAGQPLKNVALSVYNADDGSSTPPRAGECMLTSDGIEGGLIYALSAPVRDAIAVHGHAIVHLDLLPGHTAERVADAVARPRGKRSLSSHLQSTLGLGGAKAALLYECLSKATIADATQLGLAIKALPIRLDRARPIAEAISTAGGVRFEALNNRLMLENHPGLFCAGEMLDWEAPTGGYLLTACFATGFAAGDAAGDYLAGQPCPAADRP